jgi:CubicO group peptidase (beta-lactamase class C family)
MISGSFNTWLLWAFVAFNVVAQPSAPVDASHTAQVDALFAQWDKPDSPGCAVGIIKDGVLIHARGYGMANLEHGIPITRQTVFDIGSCSKQFTAFCILLLEKQGKLSLDNDVRKFVPEVPDFGRPILIRHLLYHTSGLRNVVTLLESDGKRTEDVVTDADGLRVVAKERDLNFAPGEKHRYSNTGYFLMSLIVKKVTGESLREFARKNIFEPLAMTHSHFHDDHTMIVKSRATGYSPLPGGGFAIDMSNWEHVGDGSLMTTVEDLVKWDQNFYDGKVGGKDLVRRMEIPGRLNDGTKLNYGCGLIIGEYQGTPMIHHGGAWAGYRSHILRFPERRLTFVVLGNLSSLDAWNMAGRVSLLFFPSDAEPHVSKKPAEQRRE